MTKICIGPQRRRSLCALAIAGSSNLGMREMEQAARKSSTWHAAVGRITRVPGSTTASKVLWSSGGFQVTMRVNSWKIMFSMIKNYNFPQNRGKNIVLRKRPGVPPSGLGAKCLSRVVLDKQDRALRITPPRSTLFLSFCGVEYTDNLSITRLRPNVDSLMLLVWISFSIVNHLVGEGVQKNPEQIWAYLFGILFKSFPNFTPNFWFFFLSRSNSWGKCVQHFCDGLDWKYMQHFCDGLDCNKAVMVLCVWVQG